ncbi:Ion transport protein-domain-containing protein [Pisolithus orientalis]|uniref:Ion transport protein-domain-containing protein n=1 Tax=Pisolithus orientalis TaxID=936130 RepID=UPI002225B1D0|nr:Ion transport protein-domain-containing protein [Pisolithus orientalis]KAI6015330.1 Ion transport protein-domain-containing protein [Pisolithus orientalis]
MRVANIRAQDASIRLPDDNEEEQEEEDWTPDDKPLDDGGQRHQSEALGTHETLPLRGNTLGFLGPTNSFRLRLYLMLSHPYSDPISLVLILMTAVVLVIQASRTLLLSTDQSTPSPQVGYFHAWEDYALFVLYILFTIESLARICVSGFVFDPEIPTSALVLAGSRFRSTSERTFFSRALRSDIPTSGSEVMALPFRLNIQFARQKLARNVPYLRQSWGRIDFIAVVAFWVAFILASVGVERGTYHIGIFRALSVLRIARLLAITSGTTTIMHSLKVARPLLASVAYFVVFAVLLFSIIGVQSFKGSLRRNCYLLPTLGEAQTQLSTFCGSHINASTLQPSPYIKLDGSSGDSVKGYTCPLGQICQEGQGAYSGVESFDTVWNSVLQVIVIASANTWSTVMYQTMGAEYFASCFFFVAGILVLNFWLFNLFVAVITNTFSAIRAETQKSAFGAAPLGFLIEEQDEGWPATGRHSGQNALKLFYAYARWGWIFLALASLVVQATTTANMSSLHQEVLYKSELFLAIAFDTEILIRIAAELPAWRVFFRHGNNWIDLVLAIGSSVIQIPAIQQSEVYPWLTIFPVARFYRVILEFPRMKPLLLTVFGNLYGLANMTLFLILVNFLAALVAIQFLQGDMSGNTTMNFGQLWNSFLAVYQVLSSENWTTVLYDATVVELPLGQAVIVATFISCWLLFANFIIMQMFIAVINENFSVAEEAKKEKQASNYWARHHRPQREATHSRWIRRLNPYQWFKADPVTIKVENLPSTLVLPMRESVVQGYSPPRQERKASLMRVISKRARHVPSKSITMLQRLFMGTTRSNEFPLIELRQPKTRLAEKDAVEDDTEQYLEILAGMNQDDLAAEALDDAIQERRARKADFIKDHPTYDKTFWLFSQRNGLRRLCQKIVEPAGGERIFGTAPDMVAHTIFQLLVFLTVIGGIITEIIAPPIYRRNYYLQYGLRRSAWFNIAEATFGFALFLEFLIKVVADGLLFTPNAYARSMWNVIDLVILAGLLANIGLTWWFVGISNRFVHALKALRALRLITLIDQMRSTFENLIISGVVRILDAAILAILYLIPFSVWGTNIFAGLMNECNDTSVQGISDCTGEYVNTIYGNSYGYLVPRAWNNPSPSYYIVSLEGWIDVMSVAMSITGAGQQPQTNASQAYALFFLIYNLLGGAVILTLFVSIIISNFSSKTGSAFLTRPQREWIDLEKLIKRQKSSKRPYTRPTSRLRAWCYDSAVRKHGWWSRGMTLLFVMQIMDFSLFSTSIYMLDIIVRFYGLGWESFRDNGWNIFDVIVASGSFTATIIVQFGSANPTIQQLQKLFLVCISFKLVQRVDSLNQLASLPVILNLLGLWLVVFLFFAIMYLEVFGMTKWFSGESNTQNYQSMGSALLMLSFMSTGEGWNQYMHDYATVYPRCTYTTGDIAETDCGSTAWAFSLFIAWNLLSMYIILNMFTGVVVENFSYVFQSTGGAKSITRREMRSFKKVWAEFSNAKTGQLERQNIGPFLARLDGVFETRIYPREQSVGAILAGCRDTSKRATVTGGVNLKKLNNILNKIDHSSVRKRRNTYGRLYHEAHIVSLPTGGLSFTDMLLLLAHHKLIDDREALVLRDLVVRQETNKLVTDLVNLDRVRSLLRMISQRRKYLLEREQVMNRDIPAIFVNSSPATPPPIISRDITSPRSEYETGQSDYEASSPTPSPRILVSSSELPTADRSFRSSLQRARRVSDVSMLSADMSQSYWRERSRSPEPEDEGDMISSMQRSIWGEMMLQAAQEEGDA